MTKPIDPNNETHTIASSMLTQSISVFVIGCGGNGSQMLTGLARIDRGLRAIGHPSGLDVTAYDFDRVSESNVGRQLFSPSDIGQNKATVLIHRLNCFYGLNWTARPEKFQGRNSCNILITCTDTAASRREIFKGMENNYLSKYWLDMGNRSRDGQVILGELQAQKRLVPVSKRALKSGTNHSVKEELMPRLPHLFDIFPELLDEALPEDDTPSCSLAEALEKQDLFINQTVVTFALDLLWRLFRGPIDRHGAFINLDSGHVNPLMIRQK
jgi:PRTRC genetic system ThiF family protein